MGSVSAGGQSKTWQKMLTLNGQQTTFKLDTGADVTAIPAKVYLKKQLGPLTTATKRLFRPGNSALQLKGQFNGTIKYKEQTTEQPMFVIQRLATPLLGMQALEALQLAYTVDNINEQIDIKRPSPQSFLRPRMPAGYVQH